MPALNCALAVAASSSRNNPHRITRCESRKLRMIQTSISETLGESWLSRADPAGVAMSSTKSAEVTKRHLGVVEPAMLFAPLRRQRIVRTGYAHVTIERFRIQWKNIDWLC